MGDEDIYAEEEISGGDELEVGEKSSAIKELLPKTAQVGLLVVLVAVIFIVTVVFLYYENSYAGYNKSELWLFSLLNMQPNLRDNLWWYALDEIRTRTADKNPSTVIIKAKLGYEFENADVQTDLIQRSEIIYDAMRQYPQFQDGGLN